MKSSDPAPAPDSDHSAELLAQIGLFNEEARRQHFQGNIPAAKQAYHNELITRERLIHHSKGKKRLELIANQACIHEILAHIKHKFDNDPQASLATFTIAIHEMNDVISDCDYQPSLKMLLDLSDIYQHRGELYYSLKQEAHAHNDLQKAKQLLDRISPHPESSWPRDYPLCLALYHYRYSKICAHDGQMHYAQVHIKKAITLYQQHALVLDAEDHENLSLFYELLALYQKNDRKPHDIAIENTITHCRQAIQATNSTKPHKDILDRLVWAKEIKVQILMDSLQLNIAAECAQELFELYCQQVNFEHQSPTLQSVVKLLKILKATLDEIDPMRSKLVDILTKAINTNNQYYLKPVLQITERLCNPNLRVYNQSHIKFFRGLVGKILMLDEIAVKNSNPQQRIVLSDQLLEIFHTTEAKLNSCQEPSLEALLVANPSIILALAQRTQQLQWQNADLQTSVAKLMEQNHALASQLAEQTKRVDALERQLKPGALAINIEDDSVVVDDPSTDKDASFPA